MIKFRAWDNPTEKFRRTEKGVITNLYQKLKKRNNNNGFGDVPFDLKHFYDWSMEDRNFHRLFRIWMLDNYSKASKPSVDRINPLVGYEFDNMQWLSWNENYYKGIYEVAKKKEKPVAMYKDGVYIGKFRSVRDAQYFLDMKSNGNISSVLSGKRNSTHGYYFEYINPELLEEEQMKLYRKTATIRAERFDGSEEMVERYGVLDTEGAGLFLPTLEGNLEFHVGDWIVTGVKGEHWAIADDVFKQTYAELPAVPQYVAECINYMKSIHCDIWDTINYPFRSDNINKYMEDNSETFASAWLDGYQVEEEK